MKRFEMTGFIKNQANGLFFQGWNHIDGNIVPQWGTGETVRSWKTDPDLDWPTDLIETVKRIRETTSDSIGVIWSD